MFEELIDVKKMINPESYNPMKIARPNMEPQVEYEDTPEFRQSLNMKVMQHFKYTIFPCIRDPLCPILPLK